MRVISGSARGLKLKSPEGLKTRPTTDRIKESLFNIISNDLLEVNFLDLFSGSGAIGIEALSRGADKVIFIENSKEAFNTIKENLEKAKFISKAQIYNQDYITALNQIKKTGILFDIIFMDPPYSQNIVENALKIIENLNILKKDGIIICEQHINDFVPNLSGFENYRTKLYKTTKIVFFKNIMEVSNESSISR